MKLSDEYFIAKTKFRKTTTTTKQHQKLQQQQTTIKLPFGFTPRIRYTGRRCH